MFTFRRRGAQAGPRGQSWSSVWYLLSSYAVISYTENWLTYVSQQSVVARRLRNRHFSASAAVTFARRIATWITLSVANDRRTMRTPPWTARPETESNPPRAAGRGPFVRHPWRRQGHDDSRSGCGSESPRHQVFSRSPTPTCSVASAPSWCRPRRSMECRTTAPASPASPPGST